MELTRAPRIAPRIYLIGSRVERRPLARRRDECDVNVDVVATTATVRVIGEGFAKEAWF